VGDHRSGFVRAVGSGCGSEGHGEPECFELADVVAGLAVGVGAAGVVAGAEIAEAGGGVCEQVPDDDQDGAGDSDEGLELAPAFVPTITGISSPSITESPQ
jgi:hypothetical protein